MDAQKEARSLKVILQKAPNKKVEEALIHLLTEKLHVLNEDAAKVIHAVPIILFDELTVKEAEQLNLLLKQLGAKSAISNDPNDHKKFPRVHWPKKIEMEALGKIAPERIAPPPPSAPPSAPPPRPSAQPAPSASPSFTAVQEWRTKYDALEKSYLDSLDRLKKREAELKASQDQMEKLQKEVRVLPSEMDRSLKKKLEETVPPLEMKVKVLSEEKEQLTKERHEIQTRAETLAQEKDQVSRTYLESQRSLEEKVRALSQEKERLAQDRTEMQHRAEAFERQLRHFEDLNTLLEKEEPLLELEKAKAQLQGQIETTVKRKEELRTQLGVVENLLIRHTASAKVQK